VPSRCVNLSRPLPTPSEAVSGDPGAVLCELGAALLLAEVVLAKPQDLAGGFLVGGHVTHLRGGPALLQELREALVMLG
jgi:hypothetical protein